METWKDIPGYEGKYQASDAGRICSVTRLVTQIGRWGKPFTRELSGQVLKPGCTKRDAHLRVALGRKTAMYTGSYLVHQLIALTFLGPRPTGLDVRHLDGNIQNNAVANLCYGSRADNILDVYRVGRAWRKLTIEQVQEIRERLAFGARTYDLAKEYGLSQGPVCNIKSGRAYGWL